VNSVDPKKLQEAILLDLNAETCRKMPETSALNQTFINLPACPVAEKPNKSYIHARLTSPTCQTL
jgi:hypothetical protein